MPGGNSLSFCVAKKKVSKEKCLARRGETLLGAWAAEGVEAKSGPGEDSFCRVCSLIAVAMGQKAGEKWTVAAALQP
ncbi:MAG: hypothetical protein Q8O29_18615, partial [Polaromonas sp.]|nr:hypothetical protein [Polaromonas sp.]